MRITIDTRMDSKEEIRKALELLRSVIGQEEFITNAPSVEERPSEEPQPGIFNLFNDSNEKKEGPVQETPTPEPTPTNSIFDLSDVNKEEEKVEDKESAEVQVY